MVLLVLRPTLGICWMIAFYPLVHVVPRPPVPGLNAQTILVGYAMLVTFTRSGLRVPPLAISGAVLFLFATLFVGFMLASANPDAPYTTWDNFKGMKMRGFTALLFFISYWFFVEDKSRSRALAAMAVGALVIGVSGYLVPPSAEDAMERAVGVLESPNLTGNFLGVFSLVPIHLALRRQGSLLARGIYFGIYTVCVLTLLLTLARGGWLGFVIGHFVYFALVNRKLLLSGMLAGAIVLTAAFPLLPENVRNRVEDTFDTGGTLQQAAGVVTVEGSAETRLRLYAAGFDMFLASPLWGHGADMFQTLRAEYGPRHGLKGWGAPHSVVLKLGAESGLFGLMALLLMAGSALLIGLRVYFYDREEYALGALMLAVLAGTAVVNLFHSDFIISPTSSGYYWVVFGMVGALAHQRYGQPVRRREYAFDDPLEHAQLAPEGLQP